MKEHTEMEMHSLIKSVLEDEEEEEESRDEQMMMDGLEFTLKL